MADGKRKIDPGFTVDNRGAMDELLSLDPETMDPNKHYRFVKDTPLRVSRHRLRGYNPVSSDEGVTTNVDPTPAEDGLIRVGDVILMACARSTREARAEATHELGERRLNSYRKAKKELKGIAEKGEYEVPIYTESPSGRDLRVRKSTTEDED